MKVETRSEQEEGGAIGAEWACIVYDVETVKEAGTVERGWDNPEGMGFASAVAYDYVTDRYHFFLHGGERVRLLHLLRDRVVVTFNGVKFDSRVILGNARSAGVASDGLVLVSKGGYKWAEFDLLLKYIQARFRLDSVLSAERRLGDRAIHDGTFNLDGLAWGTLGLGKTGRGSEAPLLYRQKRYDELLSYNLSDVRLTRKLLEFVWSTGGVLFDRVGRKVRIDLGEFLKSVTLIGSGE